MTQSDVSRRVIITKKRENGAASVFIKERRTEKEDAHPTIIDSTLTLDQRDTWSPRRRLLRRPPPPPRRCSGFSSSSSIEKDAL